MRPALWLLLLLPLAAASPARAQSEDSHQATTLGPRAVFYRPRDADHGTWNGGAQLKLGLGGAYALRASVDVTHHSAAGADYREVPLQFSLLGYFSPQDPLSFYLLIGYGWYWSHVGGGGAHTETSSRPHAGGGVELLGGGDWALDASYEFIWSQVWRPNDTGHPYGSGFHERGSMITLSAVRRF